MSDTAKTPKGHDSELNPKINLNYNFIKSTLYKKLKVNKVNFKLIYKAYRDGNSSKDCHSKCDNISNILIIIKIKENNIFWGFTTAILIITNSYKYDVYSFLFSLNKNKIYNIKSNHGCAIVGWNNGCVLFGASVLSHILDLCDNFLFIYNSCVYNVGMYID